MGRDSGGGPISFRLLDSTPLHGSSPCRDKRIAVLILWFSASQLNVSLTVPPVGVLVGRAVGRLTGLRVARFI